MAQPAPTRFLVVDDFTTMRRILRNLLAELGFRQVDEASDGRVAFEMLKQNTYDFVISDINMPRVNGYELLRQIRADAKMKDVPVLLITSEASKDEVPQYPVALFRMALFGNSYGNRTRITRSSAARQSDRHPPGRLNGAKPDVDRIDAFLRRRGVVR
jgi:two-component system chemotaxis response regulator CheY